MVEDAEKGVPEGQVMLAAAFSTGVHMSLTPMSAHSAIHLQYMAALSGSPEAHMAMGYRYLYGLGLPESCESSLKHYEFAANHVVNEIETRGNQLYIDHTRLSDSSIQRRRPKDELDAELMDFYTKLAEEGDMQAAMTASSVYASGARKVAQNPALADKYLRMAAARDVPNARGQIGYKMALRFGKRTPGDEASESDLATMKSHLQFATTRGDPAGLVGTGYAHFVGLGAFQRNLTQAMEFFMRANGKHQDAAWHIGNLLMGQAALDGSVEESAGGRYLRADFAAAGQFYMQASQAGHPLAMHRVAHMLSRGFGMPRSCPSAVAAFKQLAEMGTAAARVNYAHLLLEAGAPERALPIFAYVASLGVESAQFNTAYLLTRRYCPAPFNLPLHLMTHPYSIETPFHSDNIELSEISSSSGSGFDTGIHSSSNSSVAGSVGRQEECELRALYLYMVSARQGNAEAFLRIGDSYYYGLAGTPPNKFQAATYYKLAADLHHTHAIFNLGMMHEAGDGVEQDFYLAKRFFDRAALYDADAQLPRTVALTLLESHKFLHQRFGAEVADIIVDASSSLWQSLVVAVSGLRFYIEGVSPRASLVSSPAASRVVDSKVDNKELHEFLHSLGGPLQGVLDILLSVVFGWEVFLAELLLDIWQLFGGSDFTEEVQQDTNVGVQQQFAGVSLTSHSWKIIFNTVLLTACCTAWALVNIYRLRRLRERAQR